ncbi:MAG: aspartyl protease family protein, partial [candidate division Zixibacteria bacterium]|nr:aspartyl protease family protein [candidate division Zixibacteria bacterium]
MITRPELNRHTSATKAVLICFLLLFAILSHRILADEAKDILSRLYSPEQIAAKTSLESLIARGQIKAFGLNGVFETQFLAPDKLVTRVNFDDLAFAQVYSGGEAWIVDQNGAATTLSGMELERLYCSVLLTSGAWLSDTLKSYTRTYLGKTLFEDVNTGEIERYNLALTSSTGSMIELFLDTLTGDIVGTIENFDDVNLTMTMADFREVAGQRLAYLATVSSNIPQLEMEITVNEYMIDVPIDRSVFEMPAQTHTDIIWPKQTDSVVIPIEFQNGRIYARASVNGSRPLRFILDTGAGINIINRPLLETLGLSAIGQIATKGIAGYDSAGFVKIDTFRVGELIFRGQTVAETDLSASLGLDPDSLGGILGFDFFRSFRVKLDFKNEIMTIWISPGAAVRAELAVPMTFISKIPAIVVSVAGIEGRFLVDLGSDGAVFLNSFFARKIGIDTLIVESDSYQRTSGIGGSISSRAIILPEMRIGSRIFQNQPARA